MAVAKQFDVTIALYFRVKGSPLFGYASQSFGHVMDLDKADEGMVEQCRKSMAAMAGVPPENLEFISYEEYEAETGGAENE